MSRRRLGMWIPIAVGILIEVGVAIEVNLTSNKVPQLYSRNGPLLAGLVLLLGVTFLLRLRERRHPGPAREDHGRRRLINRAKNILGDMSSTVLDEAGLGQLDLRVTVALPPGPERWKRFGRAVERTAEMRMNALPDYVDQSLDGRALIIGEPGGGKSMLMRTIALRSVERSQESTAQVPLWLDMEEWPDGKSLESWVLDSLAARKVTGENAQALLQNNDLYLFLDGLDQIPTANGQRRAFKATEEFLRRYEMCHLVMTARSDAYAALGAAAEQLPLVRISPLSPAEVSAQLRRAGSSAAGLRQAAAQDEELAKTLDTPLFLKAGLRAFRGRRIRAILGVRRTGGWDDAILAELVRLVLWEQSTPAIKPEPLLRYLTWVARGARRGRGDVVLRIRPAPAAAGRGEPAPACRRVPHSSGHTGRRTRQRRGRLAARWSPNRGRDRCAGRRRRLPSDPPGGGPSGPGDPRGPGVLVAPCPACSRARLARPPGRCGGSSRPGAVRGDL